MPPPLLPLHVCVCVCVCQTAPVLPFKVVCRYRDHAARCTLPGICRFTNRHLSAEVRTASTVASHVFSEDSLVDARKLMTDEDPVRVVALNTAETHQRRRSVAPAPSFLQMWQAHVRRRASSTAAVASPSDRGRGVVLASAAVPSSGVGQGAGGAAGGDGRRAGHGADGAGTMCGHGDASPAASDGTTMAGSVPVAGPPADALRPVLPLAVAPAVDVPVHGPREADATGGVTTVDPSLTEPSPGRDVSEVIV